MLPEHYPQQDLLPHEPINKQKQGITIKNLKPVLLMGGGWPSKEPPSILLIHKCKTHFVFTLLGFESRTSWSWAERANHYSTRLQIVLKVYRFAKSYEITEVQVNNGDVYNQLSKSIFSLYLTCNYYTENMGGRQGSLGLWCTHHQNGDKICDSVTILGYLVVAPFKWNLVVFLEFINSTKGYKQFSSSNLVFGK